MHHHPLLAPLDEPWRGGVAVLGNFDGFHRGHQELLRRAGRIAAEMHTALLAVTFDPHPRSFFARGNRAFRITMEPEKNRLLESFGLDALVTLPFTADLAGMLAPDFIIDVLGELLDINHLVVGYDYRFGCQRAGDTDMLRLLGDYEGFGVTVVEPILDTRAGDEVFSSTNIRRAIREGRVSDAADHLGHYWSVTGTVQKGQQRGRQMDFPTANIDLGDHVRPAFGVYAVRAYLADGSAHDGVANIGRRPTVDGGKEVLEVHIFDFSSDIYDQPLRVDFIEHLRAERKFANLSELKIQIGRDAEAARTILESPHPDPRQLMRPTLQDILTAGGSA